MTVAYRCQHCDNLSTLRNPVLMNLGLPFAVAAFAFFIAYNILVKANLGMLSAIALIAAVLSIQLVVVCIISRMGNHFDKA
jgi:hypothetical protein